MISCSFSNSCFFLEKVVEMGRLQTKVNDKALVIHELSCSAKEKNQVIKSWAAQSAKKDASHDNKIKQLDARLAGK